MIMIISFEGFEHQIAISPGRPFVLEIHNQMLFARIAESLVLRSGEYGAEAYSVWDDGKEINPNNAFLPVPDVFNLPWDARDLAGNLYQTFQEQQLENEDFRRSIEGHFRQINELIFELSLPLEGNYCFNVEWDLRRYLKAFSFAVDMHAADSIFDKLILFIDHCADMRLSKVLLFVNLKTFLTKDEVEKLYERLFFHETKVLMIENKVDEYCYDKEAKLVIDQDFLESC